MCVAVNVYVPKDRVTNAHQGYGFVEFRSEEDADYVSVLVVFLVIVVLLAEVVIYYVCPHGLVFGISCFLYLMHHQCRQ